MKTFSCKPKPSVIASAVQQALLTSAIQNKPVSTSLSPLGSEATHTKAAKPTQLHDFDSLPDSAFVRLPTLLLLFACSPATIWRWVKAAKIPAPKKLGPRVTAWNVGMLRQAINAHLYGGDHA